MFERFEHPGKGHQWTVLAFKGGRQIGGYIGPTEDNPLCRCYVLPPGERIISRDLPESECQEFICLTYSA